MNPQSPRTARLRRFLAGGLFATAMGFVTLSAQQYGYNQPGDKNYVNNTAVLERSLGTTSSNNQSLKITAPRAQVSATFTTAPIAVDGAREAAWDAATPYPIANKFLANMTGVAPAATAQGTLRLLWDGPVLYALVEVTGDATKADTGTPTWSAANTTPSTDGLVVFMDVFNDQWGLENDTTGVVLLPANPAAPATSFNNSGIPSLGSFFNPNNQDYSTRLKAYKSSGYVAGTGVNYTYEFALQMEGWGDAWERSLNNGSKVGLETAIFNQGASYTYLSKTLYYAANEGGSNLPNSERPRNRDFAEVTLAGWDEQAPFAYSGWRAEEDIRFWNSKSNPGGTGAANSGDNSVVWTPASKNQMIAAKNAYLALKAGGTATRAELDAAVQQVCQAFTGLRWADQKFPDPHDLPVQHTLPNAWKFFDPAKGTNGMVGNLAEWTQRKQEILELAQFYEYGYKPKLGVDYTITLVTNAYSGVGNPSVTALVTPTNARFAGGIPSNLTVAVTLPTAGLPAGQKAVIGFSTSMTTNGIANVALPTTWGGDNRTDTGAWGSVATGNRTGTFYNYFPYARNSTAADVSYEMATATGVSIMLDILQAAVAQNPALDAKIDPSRAITKGFSINAKLAFIAAVFDDRVKAVVAGGAGATGPANWRYNCQGQEYNFTSTPFYNPGAEKIVSHGTEGPGNSYRHNRVRETELFRHFMSYGYMYSHQEGSYGYGNYSRLPFDQALLVATLAPERAIIIDSNLNDYNDGAVTDNLSLQIAKFVYKGLGSNGDNYVKFNIGNYVSSGDPHGAAGATPEAHYLSDLFYGTNTLTAAETTRLNTDPYALNVANGQTQTPYDYYWGGYNTITGGNGGVAGTDGWFSYKLNPPAILVPPSDQTATVGDTVSFAVATDNSGPLTYQWRKNGVSLAAGGTASGVSSPTLTLTAITTADAGGYDCVVTNPLGSTASATATLTVNKAMAQVMLQSLSATYDGGPHAAMASTIPASLTVILTYDGAAVVPVNAGSYVVAATVDDPNYVGTAYGTLVVARAPATVSLGMLAQTYDGGPRAATVTTNPAGLGVQLAYNGSASAPVNAGSYAVTAAITDPNYSGTASGTLVVGRAAASVTLGALAQIYDGTPRTATAITNPAGLGVQVTYNGSAAAPVNVGSYALAATVTDPNYAGATTGTLTVSQANGTISLAGLKQGYDGTPRVVTATTNPAGLTVDVTYDGAPTPPTLPGSYSVVATINDPNHVGTLAGTLTVTVTALVRHAPTLNGDLDGSLQLTGGESFTLNGNNYVAGDLLVTGTPTVKLNGKPLLSGTRDAEGAVTPGNYTITLNGNSVVRYIVRRVDPLSLPVVTAPQAPAGTRDVTINNAAQEIGDYGTIRNLTLNGNAGSRTIPAGTYGSLTANADSDFVLGIPGASEPAVYQLQKLALNGNATLHVVGPVILKLGNGLSVNGSMGSAQNPEWLDLQVASGGVTLSGQAMLHGIVTAPNSKLVINGGAALHGRVSVDQLTINGSGVLEETLP
jgi:hypothetical protein